MFHTTYWGTAPNQTIKLEARLNLFYQRVAALNLESEERFCGVVVIGNGWPRERSFTGTDAGPVHGSADSALSAESRVRCWSERLALVLCQSHKIALPPRLPLDARAHGAGRLAQLASAGAGELREIGEELARFADGPDEIARDERFWAPVQQAFTVNQRRRSIFSAKTRSLSVQRP